MKLLFLFLTFKEIFCISSRVSGKCIFAVLPNDVLGNISIEEDNMLQLHTISRNEGCYNTVIRFISDMYYRDGNVCTEIIGVVGELDYQTASIIHTLANRSNLSTTLVASSTPPNSLPVSNLELPNVLDMNPLQHYIDAVASFVDELNWTRIGLISDDTYYHLFAAEMLQKKLFEKTRQNYCPIH